jgi:hypothetical protein
MNRIVLTALLAVLLAFSGTAGAEIIVGTTSFTGTDTNYAAITSYNSLPYTDSNGITVSSTDSDDSAFRNLRIANDSGSTAATWASTTATGFSEIGLAFASYGEAAILTGVTLSNGDSLTNLNYSGDSFIAIADTTSFSSATLTFDNSNGFNTASITDFIFTAGTPSVVPEPSSLINIALAAGSILSAVAYRRVRRRSALVA